MLDGRQLAKVMGGEKKAEKPFSDVRAEQASAAAEKKALEVLELSRQYAEAASREEAAKAEKDHARDLLFAAGVSPGEENAYVRFCETSEVDTTDKKLHAVLKEEGAWKDAHETRFSVKNLHHLGGLNDRIKRATERATTKKLRIERVKP